MFNTINNQRQELILTPTRQTVGGASQYEGKESSGSGYRSFRKKKSQDEPKTKPTPNHGTIDLVV